MSHWYDVGFWDACRILEDDNVSWDSLLTVFLCVMDDYTRTIGVTSSICISFLFYYAVSLLKFYCVWSMYLYGYFSSYH
jgi:hypothetical protein